MELWSTIEELLAYEVLRIGATVYTLGRIAGILLVLGGTFVGSGLLQRGLHHALTRRGITDEGTIGIVGNMAHYLVLAMGFFLVLKAAGIDLGGLFAAGAVLAVGIGLAMQNTTQNFVAGISLLAERTIKPGAVIEVEGRIAKVSQMGIRATIVRTRDGEEMIVPNAVLIQSTVKNLTLRNADLRIRAAVGVVYGADMRKVRATLERVARDFEGRLPTEPQVLMVEFGDNSVNWEVAVWVNDPWNARRALSRLHEDVWWALKDAGITIAFPQLDVHFDGPVTERLSALETGRA